MGYYLIKIWNPKEMFFWKIFRPKSSIGRESLSLEILSFFLSFLGFEDST